jgi:LexA DNA binding domain
MRSHLKGIMQKQQFDSGSLTQRLKDRQVSRAVVKGTQEVTVQFSDGTTLTVEARSEGLFTRVERSRTSAAQDSSNRPTQRQLEYLAFIAKYIQRFGRAPAERDIERHFLVSAPTVNQMMQMLERRGFITRQPGVPRSIRILGQPGIQ